MTEIGNVEEEKYYTQFEADYDEALRKAQDARSTIELARHKNAPKVIVDETIKSSDFFHYGTSNAAFKYNAEKDFFEITAPFYGTPIMNYQNYTKIESFVKSLEIEIGNSIKNKEYALVRTGYPCSELAGNRIKIPATKEYLSLVMALVKAGKQGSPTLKREAQSTHSDFNF